MPPVVWALPLESAFRGNPPIALVDGLSEFRKESAAKTKFATHPFSGRTNPPKKAVSESHREIIPSVHKKWPDEILGCSPNVFSMRCPSANSEQNQALSEKRARVPRPPVVGFGAQVAVGGRD